jgi:DNA-binding LacI/PurR family transcriptional regulator
MAVDHLASLGHRRIAFVTGVGMHYPYQHEALAGFRAGLREHRLDEDERLIGRDPFARDLGPDALRAWLNELGEPPTAIFCTEPSKMDLILRPLREAGIEVPRQMSLLSCEVASAQTSNSGLTRIEMPMAEVGRQGAMLLHKIVTEARVASCQIKLTPTLVEGWSTCPRISP